MSDGDKRKVSTDALETLGTIIGPGEKRDAIHLAVLPVKAAHALRPSDPITCRDGEATFDAQGIGIVDPFLSATVRPGEMFWMVLRPRLITSLRHVWAHPALPDEPVAGGDSARKAQSEKWLRDFCAKADCPDYESLVKLVAVGSFEDDHGDCVSVRVNDQYMTFIGRNACGEIPPEFWTHLEIVTGRSFPDRPVYFACSC